MVRISSLAAVIALVFTSVAAAQFAPVPTTSVFTPLAGNPSALLSANTNLDDSTVAVALPFGFPWLGGTVTTIGVHTNGSIHLDGSLSSFTVLRNNSNGTPARIGVAQEDLNPSAAGDIFLLDTGSSFIVSWEGVDFFGSAASFINAQVELFPNGNFELRYGANNSGTATNNIHAGPVAVGALGLTANPVITQFNALGATTGGVLPQNTAVRFERTGPQFQANQANSTLNLDGVALRSICVNEFAQLEGSTALAGSPHEVLINAGPRVALNAGGFDTAGLQTFNVSFAPGQLLFLGPALGLGFFTPHPGSFSFGVFGGTPFIASAQQMVFDASNFDGYSLSQAVQLTVGPTGPNFAGPTGDDAATTITFSAFPTCAGATTIPFAGTSFTQIRIDTNGRILFNGDLSDFTPTVAEALADPQFGYWTDFNQSAGGNITFTADVTGFSASWNNVPFFGNTAQPQNLVLSIDAAGVITIDVGGILPKTAGSPVPAFFGVSTGSLLGTSTDAGVTAFTAGGVGGNVLASDMLYDFANPALNTLSASVASLQTGSGLLVITPTGTPGLFTWAGF